MEDVTLLIAKARAGDRNAFDGLFVLLSPNLRHALIDTTSQGQRVRFASLKRRAGLEQR